ncbi:MAG: DUF4389 domain-containing protein [Chloroflexi bacterium]|nr:DUF4389 domain-containing protein [Chloroflexota bacterium]
MTTATAGDQPASGYPINYAVSYPTSLSRGLIFVKWLLAVPHLLILYALNAVFEVLTFIAFFAILFTARYPKGLFDFNVGIRRWYLNVFAYICLQRDEYPPFSLDAGAYPVAFEVEYPASLNRWLIFIKWLLAIPHLVIIAVLSIIAFVVTIVAWFAILLTGKYPEGMFNFVVGVTRWTQRVTLYVLLMTDKYPPFSLEP